MTSKSAVSQCFVYITLPDEISPVAAGRFQLTIDKQGVSLGRFVYGKQYLENPRAMEFDPVVLKLAPRTYETTLLNGVFGALRDASGRRVIERNVGKADLGEMDYLLRSPDDRTGELGFGLTRLRSHSFIPRESRSKRLGSNRRRCWPICKC